MSKTHIIQAQTALAAAGFYSEAIDGDFGKDSLGAVLSMIENADKAIDVLSKPDAIKASAGPDQLSVTDKYKLSDISKDRLSKVHADLQKVVERAIRITDIDFSVGEGLRTLDRQKELVRKGASQTMNSRHLTGHAVDLIALDDKGNVSWDWPLYYKIEKAMKQAAKDVGVKIEWGGDWKTFKDGPHYQLPWSSYPK